MGVLKQTYKPSSVLRFRSDNHSSGMLVTVHLLRSTRKHRAGYSQTLSYLILLQERFTLPILSPELRWALTPPFHHCLCSGKSHRLCLFCGTVCRITPPGCYPAPCPVELGLSSNPCYTTLAIIQFTLALELIKLFYKTLGRFVKRKADIRFIKNKKAYSSRLAFVN
ncbi:hypothetical protein U27_06004 [Candidatus Vecturithrix granuli]|uniref:Uncharacterized protein n=1 Tax=Vecturithrix granuli TaxID=1499967 RepID=A0A081C373_VECG1|nr:hypothetical protein U27_06004 [Candidatus Vecturithrix granuli]